MKKAETRIDIYEIDGKGNNINGPQLTVINHWSRRALVVIEIDEKEYTVSADDLIAGIQNAQNIH